MRRRLLRLRAALVRAVWREMETHGAIGPHSTEGRRFHAFGEGSVICFPQTTILNPEHVAIGRGTMIGSHVAISAGMVEGQVPLRSPVVRIGDRCLIGRGSGIVGHLSIDIGDDVWTGHYVYVTDQNHGYEDVTRPIGAQTMTERAVRIGEGSWIGAGSVILPGATIGRHVVIGANSVVTGEIPDRCVAVGAPARVVRRHVDGEGWVDSPR